MDSLIFLAKLCPSLPIIWKLEALHLFRDWERLWLRASDYKNHRIFTLRCIHKELVPVSVNLKTTIKIDKAKKIIKNAARNLLQARVKAINSILDNISKQTELCRSKLASILSTQRFRECQSFMKKVGEIRFNKVKYRQVNKFNNLLRKEGNMTGVSSQLTAFSSQTGRQVPTLLGSVILPRQSVDPPWEGLVASQAGRQAGAHLPGDSATSQAVSTVSRGGSSLVASQAGRQAGSHLPGDNTTSQAVSTISWEGGGLVASQAGSQAGSHLLGDSTSSQASSIVSPNSTPAGEGPSQAGNNPSTQAGRQAGRQTVTQTGNNPSTQAGRQAVTQAGS